MSDQAVATSNNLEDIRQKRIIYERNLAIEQDAQLKQTCFSMKLLF